MDCAHCEELLLDWLDETLDATRSAAVRAHVDECDKCARSLSQIEGGLAFARELPLLDPPASIDAAVMDAARRKAAMASAGAAIVASPTDSLWQRFVEGLRGVLTGPQVAMATVMLLVVAIGLLYVPGRPPIIDPGQTVATPEVDEAAPVLVAPAPEAAPAPTVAMEDPRTPSIARGRLPAEPLEAPATNAPRRELPAQEESVASVDDARRDGAEHERRQPETIVAAADDRAQGYAEQAQAPAPPPAPTVAMRSLSANGTRGEGLGDLDAMAEVRSGRAARRAAEPSGASGGSGAGTLATGPIARTPAAAPAARASAPPSAPMDVEAAGEAASAPTVADASTRYEQAMASARAGQHSAAQQGFRDVLAGSPSPALAADARLGLARAQRASGLCAQAIASYEGFLRMAPSHGSAGQAMLEVASCYERIGRVDDAERWYELAAQNAATQTVAERNLQRVRARNATRARPPAAAAEAGAAAVEAQ